jgi:hypothetical protein
MLPLGEAVAVAAVEAATLTVAEFGEPKPAAPATAVNATLKFLPAALAVTGTVIVCGAPSPSAHVSVPVVVE